MTTPQPPYGTPAYHTWNAQQIVQGETHHRGLAGGSSGAATVWPWTRKTPRGKYLRRITRIIIFGFLAYACLSIAVFSYVHGHRAGYTPFSQISTTSDPHPNPLPFVVVGLFFGLLAVLQVAKTIRVYRRRREERRRDGYGYDR